MSKADGGGERAGTPKSVDLAINCRSLVSRLPAFRVPPHVRVRFILQVNNKNVTCVCKGGGESGGSGRVLSGESGVVYVAPVMAGACVCATALCN